MSTTLYTTKGAAERLHTTARQVTIWCAGGELRASKVGRQWLIAPEDLDAFVEERANRARRRPRRRRAA